ncbi:MAG: putative secreted protein [Paracoccaceae bacterium]|jgi:predicted secreted protein|tara:strand:- start:324 stop:620 length:297 start_codon:yes stop_codon:yes gene_type:complete
MAITSALVLLAVIWFMTLFIVLPLVTRTQADEGIIVPGTHASAPSNFKPGRTAGIVTVVAIPLWILLSVVILSGWITVDDFDLLKRFGPDSVPGGTGG